MKKPAQTPIDPDTPRTKQVKQIPMPQLYPESMSDDLYIPSDTKQLDKINKLLDEASDENNNKNNS